MPFLTSNPPHQPPKVPVLPESAAGDAPQADVTETPESEIAALVDALTVKFEELTLIHQLTESMQLDRDAVEVCQALVDQMHQCVDADSITIDLDYDEESQFQATSIASDRSTSIDPSLMPALIDTLERTSEFEPVAVDNALAAENGTLYRVVGIAIIRGGSTLGRIYAVRQFEAAEFGTVEADLMKSSSMLLGVHLVNQRQFHQMQLMFEGTIHSLVSALDAKDAYTSGHSSRVADLAVELARRLEFDDDGLARIHMAGMLHDVGKIGVDDSVLRKPGRLTPEEFEEIKKHPVLGYEILKGIPSFREILPAVRHHHESMDGSGYPDGLVGDEIPRDAQVLAVADAFDAMTSDRPYREGMPIDRVVKIFAEGHNRQWAGDVVDVLLNAPEVMHTYSLKNDAVVAGEASK